MGSRCTGLNRAAGKRLASVVLTLGLALASVAPSHGFRNVPEGGKAPDFTLKGLDGKTVSLGSHAGKAVVLAFVRQGQERSAEALADLAKLDRALAERALVVSVVLNPAEGDAAQWVSPLGVTFPVLLDDAGEAYGLYGVMVAPSTGVIAPDGTFRGEVGSHTAGYLGEVEDLVREALGIAAPKAEAATAEASPGKTEERKSAERHLEKARLLLKRKMADKAVAAAEEAVAADPTYADAHVTAGELLLDLSDDRADEALGHFEKALALSPKDVGAKVGVARVKGVKGDHEAAAEMLLSAAKINPKPEKLYYELGRVYERAGQFEQAVGAYRKALERLLE